MNFEKDQALRYLADLRSYYATYHNHKETSAWAATAFCVLLAGPGVATFQAHNGSLPFRVIATAVLVGMLLAMLGYLHRQFGLRQNAANVVEACDYWAICVLTTANKDLKVDFELAAKGDAGAQGPPYLPNCVQIKAESLGRKGQKAWPTLDLEDSTYFLLVAPFGLVLFHIWV